MSTPDLFLMLLFCFLMFFELIIIIFSGLAFSYRKYGCAHARVYAKLPIFRFSISALLYHGLLRNLNIGNDWSFILWRLRGMPALAIFNYFFYNNFYLIKTKNSARKPVRTLSFLLGYSPNATSFSIWLLVDLDVWWI